MFGHLGQTEVVQLGGRLRPLEHVCVEYRLALLWGLKYRQRRDAVGSRHRHRYHFRPRAAALFTPLLTHLYGDAVAGGNGVKGEGSFRVGMQADLVIRLRAVLAAVALDVTCGAVRVFVAAGLLPAGPQVIGRLPVGAPFTVALALCDALTRQTLWKELG